MALTDKQFNTTKGDTMLAQSNAATLTHRIPKESFAAKATLHWSEVVRQIDAATTDGKTPVIEACRKLWARSKPLGAKGNPFASAESLAASISAWRIALVSKRAKKRVVKKRSRIAEVVDKDDSIKAQVRKMLTLPNLDDATRIKVALAIVEG